MIRTLLLTGQNNHDWRRSAPFCKRLLEDTGRFAVEISEDPNAALAAPLRDTDLIFLDYNGALWNETAQRNFADAVRGGTGVTVLHAANNAFTGWVEYEKIIGLAWRKGTGHGDFHEFTVHVTDREHPITRGVEDFRTSDELYHRLVSRHDTPYHVLATAYSSPESRGTGSDEPMMITLTYGSGRVFHQILGHVWPGGNLLALENPGFQTTLVRGSEWAATGAVTE